MANQMTKKYRSFDEYKEEFTSQGELLNEEAKSEIGEALAEKHLEMISDAVRKWGEERQKGTSDKKSTRRRIKKTG